MVTPAWTRFGTSAFVTVGIGATVMVVDPELAASPSPEMVHEPALVGVHAKEPNPFELMFV